MWNSVSKCVAIALMLTFSTAGAVEARASWSQDHKRDNYCVIHPNLNRCKNWTNPNQ